MKVIRYAEVVGQRSTAQTANALRRCLARGMDMAIWLVLIGLLAKWWPNDTGESPLPLGIFIMLAIPLALVFDALLYGLMGSTLGKAALRIRVTDRQGRALSFAGYLHRNLHVWAGGFGFALPFILALAMIKQKGRLAKGELTSYDAALGTRVIADPIGGLPLAPAM